MFECDVCGREFLNWFTARRHMNARGHWGCDTCNDTFWTEEDSQEHMDYYDHRGPKFECDTCSSRFWTEEDAQEHMDYYEHRGPSFECEACSFMFFTSQEARIHMDRRNHWRSYWCESCQKGFQNENNLRMHFNGRAHRSTTLSCPFCTRPFTTASGLTTHLETASCPKAPSVNHVTIHQQIQRRDPNNLIAKKSFTYSSSTPVATTVTSASWNGHGYECYICHREFPSLTSLGRHVNSPAHRQAVYHCPGRRCTKEFTTLAGLFGHLESETCGAVRFEMVQKKMSHLLTGRKMISF